MTEHHRMSLRIPTTLYNRLKALAEADERTPHWMALKLLTRSVVREELTRQKKLKSEDK